MANKDRPRGFWPIGTVKQQLVAKAGTAVYAGEFVTLASDGLVDAAAAAGDIYGLALSTQETVGGKVLLSVAPEQLYGGQCASADIDAQTDIGQTCDITATAQNATYKAARFEIDGSSIGASQQLVILGIEESVGNALGEFVDCRVKINQHQAFGTDDFAGV